LVADKGDPIIADFYSNIDRVHEIAERTPGFICNFDEMTRGEQGKHLLPDRDLNRDRIVISFTMWEDIPSLARFTYKTLHNRMLEQRVTWSEKHAGPTMVIFEVADRSKPPTLREACEHLARLEREGPRAGLWGREALAPSIGMAVP